MWICWDKVVSRSIFGENAWKGIGITPQISTPARKNTYQEDLSSEISSCQSLHKRSIDLCYTKVTLEPEASTSPKLAKIQTLMPHSNLLNHLTKFQ